MIIKKYVAHNINEAMTRAKFELGNDAIVISQRKIRKPGFFGLFSGKLIEITAAVENAEEKIKPENNVEEVHKTEEVNNADDDFRRSIESIKKIMEKENLYDNEHKEKRDSAIEQRINEHNKNVLERSIENVNIYDDKKDSVEGVRQEVSELKGLINKVIENTSNNKYPSPHESIENSRVLDMLEDIDIDKDFYDDICSEISNNEEDDIEVLRDIIERDVLVSTKSLSGKVVLVGPTGVGKTTTIAKLAGRLALVEKKNVGLITVDTYRIGAIEQLKTYAEIMNIPFSVVITTKEMESAIESMKDCDVILIDTTGRSSKNTMQISELRTFINKAQPDIINMVISATTKNRDLKIILEGYSELKYNNVIITKLDETTTYGCLYNIAKVSNKPVSFITTGQNVPDDIQVPDKEEIARLVLGEETIC